MNTSPKASRYRWVICGLLFSATAINYIDRQIIGVLKPQLAHEFHWTETNYGDIVFWFQAAYAIGYLGFGRLIDQIGMAAATADARTCHIGDGDHMLANGVISHVNRTAAAIGCAPGQTVRQCAEQMRAAPVPTTAPPPITEGARFVIRDVPNEPALVCADSIGMLQPDDTGRIVVTASHGALSGGRPDNTVPLGIHAVFFSDAGGGKDNAGIARLDDLDRKGIIAAATSADSAPIGDSRALYRDGVFSHINGPASRAGAQVGMKLKDFIEMLIAAAKR